MQKAPRRQPGIPSCCPNTRGARGLQIPQQDRENHATGKPLRWRRTTWQGHNQHPPRDELPKRGPRWSSCSLSGGSRAAAKKDEITAAHSAEPAELGGGSEGIYYRVHEARKPQRWSCSASGARADSKRSTDSKRSDPSTYYLRVVPKGRAPGGPAQNRPQCPPNRPLTHGTRLGGEWG